MSVAYEKKPEAKPWFPLLLLLIAALGLGVTLAMGRTDLTIASLTIVVPLVLGATVLLSTKTRVSVGQSTAVLEKISFVPLALTTILVFVVTLIILVNYPTRPLAYFLLVSISSAMLLLQIVSRRPRWTDSFILVEIMFLSLCLIWGVSLKYPLYFADTDSLIHLSLIDSVLKNGNVTSFVSTYQDYPLYHIFTAMGIEITDLSVRTALFVLMGLAWQVGILFAFLIFRDLSKSLRTALIAALFFATTSQIIFYGGYAIARSLALVFLMCWLFLIFRRTSLDFKYQALSLIVMFALITTHHINILLIIPMLLVIYICQLFINKTQRDRPLEPLYILLVTITSLSYMIWVASDMTASIVPGTIANLLATDTDISLNVTRGYGLSVLLGAVYYSFVLFLCVLGIRVAFNQGRVSRRVGISSSFALAGLCLLVFYVPSFLDLLSFSDIIFLKRIQLMVTPLIAFLMAYGILYLFNSRSSVLGYPKSLGSSILPAIFVGLMTFFSVIGIGNAQDYDNFPHTENVDTPYFTNSELESFSFIKEAGAKTLPFHSDYQTIRNHYMLNDFTVRQILRGGNVSYISSGYLALRTGELERKGALSFSSDGTSSGSFRYSIDPNNPDSNILVSSESNNEIYTNNSVQIFFK